MACHRLPIRTAFRLQLLLPISTLLLLQKGQKWHFQPCIEIILLQANFVPSGFVLMNLVSKGCMNGRNSMVIRTWEEKWRWDVISKSEMAEYSSIGPGMQAICS